MSIVSLPCKTFNDPRIYKINFNIFKQSQMRVEWYYIKRHNIFHFLHFLHKTSQKFGFQFDSCLNTQSSQSCQNGSFAFRKWHENRFSRFKTPCATHTWQAVEQYRRWRHPAQTLPFAFVISAKQCVQSFRGSCWEKHSGIRESTYGFSLKKVFAGLLDIFVNGLPVSPVNTTKMRITSSRP